MTSTATAANLTSLEVRDALVRALRLDLVGPSPDDDLAQERLPGWVRPSNWYLTGFLIPAATPPEDRADADEDDDLGEVPESAGLAEESTEERKAAKKALLPLLHGVELPGGGRGHGPSRSPSAGATTQWRRRPLRARTFVCLLQA